MPRVLPLTLSFTLSFTLSSPVFVVLAACSSESSTDDAGDRPSPAAPPDGPSEAGGRNVPQVDGGPDAAPVPAIGFERIDYPEPLDRPTSIGFVPGSDGELLVLEQAGRVLHFELAGDELRLLGSIEVPDPYYKVDCGLIALAFDPDFVSNRFFYVSMCTSLTQSGIFRFTFDPSDYSATAESMREILVLGDPDATRAIHNVGTIGFDAEGRLWALFGDKGVRSHAPDLGSELGKVLRIVPSRDPDEGGYEPAGDLFDENPTLYARGLRSPWRGAMDARGRLFVADVGGEDAEELNLIAPGGDHGWPAYEGPCTERCGARVNPLTSWRSEDDDPYVLDDEDAAPTTRRVAWLGRMLRPGQDGADDPYRGQLDDRLLFGDMCSGFLRVLQVDGEGEIVLDAPVGHRPHLTGIDQAADGHLYALTYGGCAYDRGTHPGGALHRVVLRD